MSGVQPLPVAPNGVAVIGKVMVCHEVDTPSNVPPWAPGTSRGDIPIMSQSQGAALSM